VLTLSSCSPAVAYAGSDSASSSRRDEQWIQDRGFRPSLEEAFIAELTDDELDASSRTSWATSGSSPITQVYEKLWRRSGTKGELSRLLSN
jgi:hypothetical protein